MTNSIGFLYETAFPGSSGCFSSSFRGAFLDRVVELLRPAGDHVHGRKYHDVRQPQPDQRIHGRVFLRACGIYGRGGLHGFPSDGLVLHQGICLRTQSLISRMGILLFPFILLFGGVVAAVVGLNGGYSVLSDSGRLPGDHHPGRELHRQERHRKHPGYRRGSRLHGDEPGGERDGECGRHPLDDDLDLDLCFSDHSS